MRVDYMCNSCGFEFSENVSEDTVARCPDCKSTEIYEVPLCSPKEGHQSWSAESYF